VEKKVGCGWKKDVNGEEETEGLLSENLFIPTGLFFRSFLLK
jgi:hypothetical protein